MGSPHDRWRRLLLDQALPCALVDLDALQHNAAVLLAAMAKGAPGLHLRVASKSLRCPALLRRILDLDPAFRGILAYRVPEARLLVDQGFDDILVAYPPARPDEATVLAALAAQGHTVRIVVDAVDQLELLAPAARAAGSSIPVLIDLDGSWRPLPGLVLGARRSPLHQVQAARTLAQEIARRPGLRLAGLMLYEAQVAGIPDRSRHGAALDPVRRLLKQRSIPAVAALRAQVLEALRAEGHDLRLVNGGGTGSLHSSARDPSLTELSAGSGFLCPHLFDGYQGLDLRPAAFFALAVCRRPDAGHVTCQGGGYPASGGIGPDRAPLPWSPQGLLPLDLEGWGEVQTPFSTKGCAETLALGDPVICRHAKAGELFERFGEILLVQGEQIVDRVPSYRGLGAGFG